MANPTVRTQIRIPQELYEQLQKAAEGSARSFNAEMVIRLESSFRHGVSPESSREAPGTIYLGPFQRWLLEVVRKVVRIEALIGAPKLSREQQAELARLKTELEEEAQGSPKPGKAEW